MKHSAIFGYIKEDDVTNSQTPAFYLRNKGTQLQTERPCFYTS